MRCGRFGHGGGCLVGHVGFAPRAAEVCAGEGGAVSEGELFVVWCERCEVVPEPGKAVGGDDVCDFGDVVV